MSQVKVYRGRWNARMGVEEGAVTVNNIPLHNYDYPNTVGFGWGYGGAGPSGLAFSILCDYFGVPKSAKVHPTGSRTLTPPWEHYWSDFEDEIVEQWPQQQDFQITSQEIADWISSKPIYNWTISFQPTVESAVDYLSRLSRLESQRIQAWYTRGYPHLDELSDDLSQYVRNNWNNTTAMTLFANTIGAVIGDTILYLELEKNTSWSEFFQREDLIGSIIHSNEPGFTTRGIIGTISLNDQGVVNITPMGERLLIFDDEIGGWNFSPDLYDGWRFPIATSSTPTEEESEGGSIIKFTVSELGEFIIYTPGAEIPVH